MPCSGANSAKPRSSPKPNAGPELQRCGSRAPGTRTQAKPAEKTEARLHRRGPKPRAHSYLGGSRRVRSAQTPADGSSCRPTKAGRRRQRRNGRTRRPCRIAFREFRRGFAWRRRAALAQRKRITTTSALRGISSSFRGRSPARLTEAVGRALTSFCDRGSSPGSCACSASDRSVAAVRQAVLLLPASCLETWRGPWLESRGRRLWSHRNTPTRSKSPPAATDSRCLHLAWPPQSAAIFQMRRTCRNAVKRIHYRCTFRIQ